jgi:hypothetical protein
VELQLALVGVGEPAKRRLVPGARSRERGACVSVIAQ